MPNNSKNSRKHKASYLISRFLNSELSFELDIDVYDVAILKICAELMDNAKNPEVKTLYGCQATIARKARVSRQYISERFRKYKKLGIFIQVTFYRGKSNKFVLGETILLVDNSQDFVVSGDL